ncbi:hypothetical protein ENUP19_0063G0020 [Entamoeba nuttalli]|uniref:Uncharacterized protein n=1 Tax=Entamoeba nuttalli TaxID=412467 RepID=A0ABQ0DDX7_9EUKA
MREEITKNIEDLIVELSDKTKDWTKEEKEILDEGYYRKSGSPASEAKMLTQLCKAQECTEHRREPEKKKGSEVEKNSMKKELEVTRRKKEELEQQTIMFLK